MPRVFRTNSKSTKKRGMPKKIRNLATAMDLLSNNESRKSEAAIEIGDLVMRKQVDPLDLVTNTNCIELLVVLMRNGVGEQRDSAAKGMSNLMGSGDNSIDCKVAAAIVDADGIDVLAHLVDTGTPDEKESSSAVLSNLLLLDEDSLVKAMRTGMLRANVLPATAKLLTDAITDDQVHHALGILSGLARGADLTTSKAIVASGALPLIVNRLACGTASQKAAAASAVCNLALRATVVKILVEKDVVSHLVALVARGDDMQRSYATSALTNLADISKKAKLDLLNAGGTPALRGLLTNTRIKRDIKRKALHLLKIMSTNDDTSSDDECNGSVLCIETMCSGFPAPAQLSPEHGYVYPIQKVKSCNSRCLNMRCFTYPNCLDLTDKEDVRDWTFGVCCAHNCDPDVIDQCLSDPKTLPDNIVVRPSDETDSGFPEVYIFLVSTDGERNVYVLDISMHPVRGCRANQLPQVIHQGRRAAFAKLSDAIESTASILTDMQYKSLYDAAMAAHQATGR
tara:strand:+ start:107 stop:1642 length:1536 start_codon:yes stop_codon:yes gene_type:complete